MLPVPAPMLPWRTASGLEIATGKQRTALPAPPRLPSACRAETAYCTLRVTVALWVRAPDEAVMVSV